MAESQPDPYTSEDDLSGIDPGLLRHLSSLGGRCKELEDRCKELEAKQVVHVRSFNRQDGALRTHQWRLDSLTVKIDRIFVGWRRMQEVITFVNKKAHGVLKWAVLQIHKRRGERQDVTAQEELGPLEEMDPGGPEFPDGLQFEDEEDAPDLEANVASAANEESFATPSHKKRPRVEKPVKLWTPRSEASGHAVGGESDTD